MGFEGENLVPRLPDGMENLPDRFNLSRIVDGRTGGSKASRELMMSSWVDACAVDDIEEEDVMRVDHGGRTFAIYRCPDGEFYCTDGLCTHEQVHLADGLVMDYVIECPKHNGQFDYRTGEAMRPPVCEDLATYPGSRGERSGTGTNRVGSLNRLVSGDQLLRSAFQEEISVRHNRRTVADIRALKGVRQMSMLYVDTVDEARAAAEAGIDMLSIIDPVWTPEMREAAGDCFVQVGLLYGEVVTAEDYLRAAHKAIIIGGDCVYCAASLGTIKALADEGIPVVSHVGLIPSKCTWTGGFKAVGKTADQALSVWKDVQAP